MCNLCCIEQPGFVPECRVGETKKGGFALTSNSNDWRNFAEQVTKETDPAKLLLLITKLNEVLKRDRVTRKAAAELIAALPAISVPLSCAL
jgi:hypothetical protein